MAISVHHVIIRPVIINEKYVDYSHQLTVQSYRKQQQMVITLSSISPKCRLLPMSGFIMSTPRLLQRCPRPGYIIMSCEHVELRPSQL